MDNDRRFHLNRHVQAQLLGVTTAGLLDVEEDVAHVYLDTANALLLETLAEADPGGSCMAWRTGLWTGTDLVTQRLFATSSIQAR